MNGYSAGITICELGVGLRPSRVDGEHDPGHMWLYWTEPQSERPPFRGFRPDENQIPDEFKPENKWREFFFTRSSPGIRYIDFYAAKLRANHDKKCYDKCWEIVDLEKARLDLRCWIPPDTDSVAEGHYSWDTTRNGWNNCASWVIRTLNDDVMEREYLPLPKPAWIKHVLKAIAWDKKPADEG